MFNVAWTIVALSLLSIVTAAAQMPPVRVACIGNSITIGYGLPDRNSAYPQQIGRLLGKGYDVRNFGVGGRTMLKKGDYPYWKEKFYREALSFKPEIVTICLGTNDSKPWNWKYKADFFDDYTDMIRSFREVNPKAQIFVCLPPPVFHSKFGITDSIVHLQVIPIIKAVQISSSASLIDFYDNMTKDSADFFDGVHPDSTGDSIMARIVYNAIKESPSGIIRDFSASTYRLTGAGPVTLYWQTTNGSGVNLDGRKVNETDSLVVHPERTTIYTLITSGAVSDTSRIKVELARDR
ncbi:MAG: GDSL-type esterase/lipase family protein [Bacteroidetes bacterium]|nr:GDSL-type esterase/lipase family protein [Bacteroidota bacterium]